MFKTFLSVYTYKKRKEHHEDHFLVLRSIHLALFVESLIESGVSRGVAGNSLAFIRTRATHYSLTEDTLRTPHLQFLLLPREILR